MAERHERYESALTGRYAGEQMRRLFSAQRKFSTWRRLWLALAEAQQELGLDISDKQLKEMAAHLEDIDFEAVARREKQLRHDVMAHVYAFGDAAPAARPIIHLGATSQFVGCNTDLLLMREGMSILAGLLADVIDALGRFAGRWRDPVSYTHLTLPTTPYV